MAVFAISFRVHDGHDYEDRYNSLTAAIENEADTRMWAETTSFYLLQSEKNSADLKDSILAAADINDDDIVVVINLSVTKGHASKGVSDLSLFKAIFAAR